VATSVTEPKARRRRQRATRGGAGPAYPELMDDGQARGGLFHRLKYDRFARSSAC
jgi:hypothetical protein